MASNGLQPGHEDAAAFPEEDALASGADLEEVARYAKWRGNLIKGTTTQRLAWSDDFPSVAGVFWSDTTNGGLYVSDGAGGWVLRSAPRVALIVSAATAVSANTNINFGSVDEDTHSGWNAGTDEYTFPIAGDYLITTALKSNGSGFSGTGSVGIRSNGVTLARGRNVQTGVAFDGVNLTIRDYFAAGATLAVQHGNAFTPQNDAPARSNFLEIFRLN